MVIILRHVSVIYGGYYLPIWFNYSIWVILVSVVQLNVMGCVIGYDSVSFYGYNLIS